MTRLEKDRSLPRKQRAQNPEKKHGHGTHNWGDPVELNEKTPSPTENASHTLLVSDKGKFELLCEKAKE